MGLKEFTNMLLDTRLQFSLEAETGLANESGHFEEVTDQKGVRR
jgi:hypothetical protein